MERLTYTPQGTHSTAADLRVDHSRNSRTRSDTGYDNAGNSFLAHAKITPQYRINRSRHGTSNQDEDHQ